MAIALCPDTTTSTTSFGEAMRDLERRDGGLKGDEGTMRTQTPDTMGTHKRHAHGILGLAVLDDDLASVESSSTSAS